MRAFAPAARPGEVLAPAWFREYLKRNCGDDHDCWFHPGADRIIKDGKYEDSLPGCWVVWQAIPVIEFGDTAAISRKIYVDVYRLDGEFGLPVELGEWVVNVLHHSDTHRRGFKRNREVNDYNEKQKMNAYQEAASKAESLSQDEFLRRQFAKVAEERGVSTVLYEDHRKTMKEADKKEESLYEQARTEAKSTRFYAE